MKSHQPNPLLDMLHIFEFISAPPWLMPRAAPNPCSLLSYHTPLSGICTYTKHPQAHSKTPLFPGLNLKVGKMNCSLGHLDPIWAKCLKSGQNFFRSGQKKFIHVRDVFKTHAQDWACTCGRVPVLARALVQVLQTSGSQMVVIRCTTLSA